jgi:metal-dependent amidase/aminoacylase/carboxypeptidase family protein
VVTIGSVVAGITENIFPGETTLKINVRTVTPESRTRVLTAIKRIVKAECEASGATKEPLWESVSLFQFTINDKESTETVSEAFSKYFSDNHDTEAILLGRSGDFSILALNKDSDKGVPYYY